MGKRIYDWDFISGYVKVSAIGIDDDENIVKFSFICWIDGTLNSYDKYDIVDDIAWKMAELRHLCGVELLSVEELGVEDCEKIESLLNDEVAR